MPQLNSDCVDLLFVQYISFNKAIQTSFMVKLPLSLKDLVWLWCMINVSFSFRELNLSICIAVVVLWLSCFFFKSCQNKPEDLLDWCETASSLIIIRLTDCFCARRLANKQQYVNLKLWISWSLATNICQLLTNSIVFFLFTIT